MIAIIYPGWNKTGGLHYFFSNAKPMISLVCFICMCVCMSMFSITMQTIGMNPHIMHGAFESLLRETHMCLTCMCIYMSILSITIETEEGSPYMHARMHCAF